MERAHAGNAVEWASRFSIIMVDSTLQFMFLDISLPVVVCLT